jgi:hypothetical protein
LVSHELAVARQHSPRLPGLIHPESKGFSPTEKLRATSWGEWDLAVHRIKTSYFADRAEFDRFTKRESRAPSPDPIRDRISLEEAFRIMKTEISVDYKSDPNEKLQEKVQEWLWKRPGPYGVKCLDKKLLNEAFREMFGPSEYGRTYEEESGVKIYEICDFKLYFNDGNEARAGAWYGEYFLLFCHGTS